jgi:acetyl esterase/lipase
MLPSTLRRSVLAGLVAAVALGSLTPALAKPGKRQGPKPKRVQVTHKPEDYAPVCAGDPAAVQPLTLTVNGQQAMGLFAMPPKSAKGIVVFAHGYGHTMESWRKHITDTARRDNVVAVAMDYRGQQDFSGSPLPTSRGWRVQEGAEDSVAAAQTFARACPSASTIVMYGVSMGGNTAGLAVAAKAKRLNGKPLFDYLFEVEGAVNVTETYLEANALKPVNTFAANAVADIEQEMGGSIDKAPNTYAQRTVVNRIDDIAASGIKGVVMVQGVDDGLVGYNQSPEFRTLLLKARVPVDFWTAVTRGSASEPGTTLDGYVTGNIPGFVSPFAGHASEASDTHLVGNAGFERLAALFAGVAPVCRTGVLDGTTGYTETKPLTLDVPC